MGAPKKSLTRGGGGLKFGGGPNYLGGLGT